MTDTLESRLAEEPQTTQINVVVSLGGEYYSLYPVNGLEIPQKNQILDSPKISGINFDLRNVSTPIGTFTFEIDNTIASRMLTTPGNWLQTDCSMYMGDALNSDWTEYTKMISGVVVDITTKTNSFYFNCKEILDLIFKDFIRKTYLTADITTSSTSIPAFDTSLFQTAGSLVINEEIIGYTGKTATSFTGLTRGIYGSANVNHSKDTFIYSNYHFFNVNPITIMLQLILSKTGNSSNSAYDVLQFGLGIDKNLIDITSFEAIRTEWFPTATFVLEVFNTGNLLIFLESEILKPLNCRLVTINGKITLTLLDNYTADPVYPRFDENIVIDVPSWKIESNKIINAVEVFYSYDFGKSIFLSKKNYSNAASIALYGIKPFKFEFKGILNDTAGNALIDRLIEKFLLRMSRSRGSIQCKTFYNAYNISIGANVLLTHRYVPQTGYGMGISNVLEVISKSVDLGTGNVQFSLEFMSTAEFRAARIGPSVDIIAETSPSQFTVNRVSLFEVGHRVELMKDGAYLPDHYSTIVSIVGNEITVGPPFTSPLVGTTLKLVRYDDATVIMKRDFGYIAGFGYVEMSPTMTGDSAPVGYVATASDVKIIETDITPVMTSNVLPSGYIASASQEYDATETYKAWKAFNKANITNLDCWHTLNTSTGWLKLKFPTAVCVNSYTIEARTYFNSQNILNRTPKNWAIEGSNNDSTWTILDTQTNQTSWTIGLKKKFTFPVRNITNYLYYRINISANNGDPTYISLGELTFYEVTNSSNAYNAYDKTTTSWESDSSGLVYSNIVPPLTANNTAIIPTMTSNTAPAGYVASASHGNASAWNAFDNAGGGWGAGGFIFPSWLKIQLPVAKVATSFFIVHTTTINNASFQGSNDDSAWTNLYNFNGIVNGVYHFSNVVAYKYYRFYITSTDSVQWTNIDTLQIYETATDYSVSASSQYFNSNVLAYKVFDNSNTTEWHSNVGDVTPVMTSNTAPAGYVASASAFHPSGYYPFLAFNKITSIGNDWATPEGVGSGWLQLQFPASVAVNTYVLRTRNDLTLYGPKDWTIQASNDGTNFTVIHTITGVTWALNETKTFSFPNYVHYTYWRINVTATGGGIPLIINELTFYGFAEWVSIKLPTAKVVTRYSVTQNPGDALRQTRSPKDWQFQGSNNGTTWTNLQSSDNNTWPLGVSTKDFYLSSNQTAYLYYRFYILANGGDSYVELWGLNLYESIPTSALSPKWNSLKLPNPTTIKKYSITNKATAPVDSPKTWTLQGSNNGTTWDNIDYKTNQTDNTAGALREYELSGVSNEYLYFRIYITESNGGGTTAINELKYYKTATLNFSDGQPPYTIIY